MKNDREFRDIVEELKGTDSELKRNDMITKLIDRIMKSFKVTALCFNQKNRTIEMHTIPKTAVVFTYTSE